MTASDLDLITAAQQGNQRAYGELICRYRAGVVGVVYRMSGDLALAEEAAQEAFLRAWQRLSTYRPEHSFRAWVYRIAVNAALDALRRERRMASLEGLLGQNRGEDEEGEVDFPAPDPGPEEWVEGRQRAEVVRRAVLDLPEGSRAVLVLREYAGLSYAEIAGALGIPLGTVMSRLNSARGQLRKTLAGMLEAV